MRPYSKIVKADVRRSMRSPQRPTDSVRSLLSTLLSAETLQTITGNMLFWRRPTKD
jgi:hypothetical protein